LGTENHGGIRKEICVVRKGIARRSKRGGFREGKIGFSGLKHKTLLKGEVRGRAVSPHFKEIRGSKKGEEN